MLDAKMLSLNEAILEAKREQGEKNPEAMDDVNPEKDLTPEKNEDTLSLFTKIKKDI